MTRLCGGSGGWARLLESAGWEDLFMLEVFVRLHIKELGGNNSNVDECVFFISFQVIAVHVGLALLLLCQVFNGVGTKEAPRTL